MTSVPKEEDFSEWERPTPESYFVRELAQLIADDADP